MYCVSICRGSVASSLLLLVVAVVGTTVVVLPSVNRAASSIVPSRTLVVGSCPSLLHISSRGLLLFAMFSLSLYSSSLALFFVFVSLLLVLDCAVSLLLGWSFILCWVSKFCV